MLCTGTTPSKMKGFNYEHQCKLEREHEGKCVCVGCGDEFEPSPHLSVRPMKTPYHVHPAYDRERKTWVAVSLECKGIDQPLVAEQVVKTDDGMPFKPAYDRTAEAVYCPSCGRDMRYKL